MMISIMLCIRGWSNRLWLIRFNCISRMRSSCITIRRLIICLGNRNRWPSMTSRLGRHACSMIITIPMISCFNFLSYFRVELSDQLFIWSCQIDRPTFAILRC
eukprot:UN28287